MINKRQILGGVLALSCAFSSANAQTASCRHALVLALDVSGSVNEAEYLLQVEGVAAALLSPEVQRIILAEPSAPISLAVFEWSSDKHQQIIQNWTDLKSPETLVLIADNIRKHRKDRITLKTAIGSAMRFAKNLLDQKQHCLKQTIDVSGDGVNNDGNAPKDTYKQLGFNNITVNGLIITVDTANPTDNPIFPYQHDLKDYFDTEVIHGKNAFAQRANGYNDYKRAMTEKLLKELSPAAVSDNSDIRAKKASKPL